MVNVFEKVNLNMAAQQVQEYLERHRIGALFEVTMYIFTRFIPNPTLIETSNWINEKLTTSAYTPSKGLKKIN